MRTRRWPSRRRVSRRLTVRGGLELRRALRDQRVALAHERAALDRSRDDHLAPRAEGIGHLARVDHRQRGSLAVAVGDAEAEVVAIALDGAGHHLAGELERLPVVHPANDLRGLLRLRGGTEACVYEGSGQKKGGGERYDQPDPALTGGVHLTPIMTSPAGWGAPLPARETG